MNKYNESVYKNFRHKITSIVVNVALPHTFWGEIRRAWVDDSNDVTYKTLQKVPLVVCGVWLVESDYILCHSLSFFKEKSGQRAWKYEVLLLKEALKNL